MGEQQWDLMRECEKAFDALFAAQLKKLLMEGFKDKAEEVLEYFNTSGKFETDCKICFGGSYSDNNKVVYCNKCNTSFHRICYLLPRIP